MAYHYFKIVLASLPREACVHAIQCMTRYPKLKNCHSVPLKMCKIFVPARAEFFFLDRWVVAGWPLVAQRTDRHRQLHRGACEKKNCRRRSAFCVESQGRTLGDSAVFVVGFFAKKFQLNQIQSQNPNDFLKLGSSTLLSACISLAHHVIHWSFPSSLSRFLQRHSALASSRC